MRGLGTCLSWLRKWICMKSCFLEVHFIITSACMIHQLELSFLHLKHWPENLNATEVCLKVKAPPLQKSPLLNSLVLELTGETGHVPVSWLVSCRSKLVAGSQANPTSTVAHQCQKHYWFSVWNSKRAAVGSLFFPGWVRTSSRWVLPTQSGKGTQAQKTVCSGLTGRTRNTVSIWKFVHGRPCQAKWEIWALS